MAWNTPSVRAARFLITAAVWNADLKDNLLALKSPPFAQTIVNEALNYTTSSATFVDVDATDLALTITTAGGDVFIGFYGECEFDGALDPVFFDIHESVASARLAGDDGIIVLDPPSEVQFCFVKTGLSAASHTFKLQWKTITTTVTLYAGAGTANHDAHPVMWVRELS